MLTEVAFCLTCYFGVLTIEYVPLILENRQVDRAAFLSQPQLTACMRSWLSLRPPARFLSFFHQGSLGGVSGVLFGRPFGYREGVFIWPWTFFLFTWSAAACGPCFTILVTKITEAITRKRLVKDNVIELLAKIAGWMLATYMVAKIIDTMVLGRSYTAPSLGFSLMDFYSGNPFYGVWILMLEIILGGIIPAAILITPKWRKNPGLFMTALVLAVIGVCVNRWVMVLQVMAAPVMSFDSVGHVFPQLAGNCDHNFTDRLRHHSDCTVISLPADISAGTGTQSDRDGRGSRLGSNVYRTGISFV